MNQLITEWLMQHRDEIVAEARRCGCTAAPYLTVAEAMATEQIGSRRFLQPVDLPGAPAVAHPTHAYRFDGEPPRVRPAPVRAEAVEAAAFLPRVAASRPAPNPGPGCLAGLRVVDFTWALAGPTATMILAALGAEVIKVESAARPDVLRRNPGLAATTGRQKRSLSLDLRHPEGLAIARRLIGISDVVAENFRPGVMDRLGLGIGELRAQWPDLVVLSVSMSGQTGPAADQPGYAPMFAALGGLGDATGYSDGPPTQIRTSADVNAGVAAVLGVLAALEARRAGRGGCHVDLSAVEAQMALVGELLLEQSLVASGPTRSGNDEPDWVPHGCYPSAGADRWVSVVVEDDEEWEALASVLGLDAQQRQRWGAIARRRAERDAVDAVLASWTSGRSPAEAEAVLQAAGVAAVEVLDAAGLAADPHMQHRGFVAHAPGTDRAWPVVALGGKLPATPLVLERAGPTLGADNDEVLGVLLGLSDGERRRLAEEGVLT